VSLFRIIGNFVASCLMAAAGVITALSLQHAELLIVAGLSLFWSVFIFSCSLKKHTSNKPHDEEFLLKDKRVSAAVE
jgi:hypothetical protein